MGKEFVTIRGEKFNLFEDSLDLSELEIEDIANIKGLQGLTRLKWLNLGYNQIKEIKGLENLSRLEFLDLGDNHSIDGLWQCRN